MGNSWFKEKKEKRNKEEKLFKGCKASSSWVGMKTSVVQ